MGTQDLYDFKEKNYPDKEEEEKKDKRKPVSKKLKNEVWEKYIGKTGVGLCTCCSGEISILDFYCSRVEFKDEATIDNLRPICASCSRVKKSQNLFEFKEKYFGKKETVIPDLLVF